MITLCSFCQRVKTSGAATWHDAERYYQAGGTSKVQISHGICNDCAEKHAIIDSTMPTAD